MVMSCWIGGGAGCWWAEFQCMVPLLAKEAVKEAVEEEVRTRWGAGGMDGKLVIAMSMFMLEW